MKNIDLDSEDTLRSEYDREDFSQAVRGKFATTQVSFHQLTQALVGCVGEDEGLKFVHYSSGNDRDPHKLGDWTYEIDNGNQITLRYWQSEFSSIDETLSNNPVVRTPEERTQLHYALAEGVARLKTKVSD